MRRIATILYMCAAASAPTLAQDLQHEPTERQQEIIDDAVMESFDAAMESFDAQADMSDAGEAYLSDAIPDLTMALENIFGHRPDINTLSADTLALLPFLPEWKARAMVRHRDRVGGFETEQELMTVSCLTASEIYQLINYVSVGSARSEPRRREYVKADMVARTESTWPRSRGYADKDSTGTDSAGTPFAGSPRKGLVRARATVADQVAMGIVAETDAGEPRLSQGGALADFVAGFVRWHPTPDILGGAVRHITVGNYNVRIGQGLGIWTGFGFSPTVTGASPMRVGTGITPSASASESDYLRGAATEIAILPWRLMGFYSIAKADATLAQDEQGKRYIANMRSSGLHRTATERENRHNVWAQTWGLYASHDMGWMRAGVGWNTRQTSIPWGNGSKAHLFHRPTGLTHSTLHADARAYVGLATIYGEVAWQGPNAWAGTIGADIAFGGPHSASFALRRFGKSYWAALQQPVSQTSTAGGESGGYIGVSTSLPMGLDLRAGVDMHRVSWLRNNIWAPTTGWRLRAVGRWTINRASDITITLRHTDKETTTAAREISADPDYDRMSLRGTIGNAKSSSLKMLLSCAPTDRLALHTLVERTRATQPNDLPSRETTTRGLLLCQDAKYTTPKQRVTMAASLSYFHTGSYAARVYTRQPHVLHDMSFAACSGEGVKATAMVKIAPTDFVRLWIWTSHTKQMDSETIGSGNDMTAGDHRTTVKAQIQIKLWHRKRRDYFGNETAKAPMAPSERTDNTKESK